MAPLLTLFLVALVGLPLGKMDGEQKDGQPHVQGQVGQKWGGRPELLTTSPSSCSALGKVLGPGVWWAGGRASPSSGTRPTQLPPHPLAPSPGSGLPRVRLQWRELLQSHALPSHGHLLHDHAHL